MEYNEKLPLIDVVFILFLARLAPTYLNLPALTAPPANQDIWFVQIVGIAYTMAACFPLLYLSNKFNDLTLIEIIQKLCGKFLGNLLGILYVVFMIYIVILGSAETTLFLGSAIMPETPNSVILIFLLLTCCYMAYKGINAIGRSAVIYAPIVLVIIVLFTILNIEKMNFKTFLPVLADTKLWQINVGASAIATRFYDIILLSILTPKITNKKNISKSFFYALGIYSLIAIMMIVSVQAVLGIEQAKHARYSYLIFTRQINVFDFIQRIEALNIMSWFFARFIKISIYIYAAALSFKNIFNVKNYNKFIVIISLLIYFIVNKTPVTKSVVYSKLISYKVFPYITGTFQFVIPLFLLVLYFIRKKFFKDFCR